MYSNNILNFQESITILNACIKKSGNLLNAACIYLYLLIEQSKPKWCRGSNKYAEQRHCSK